MGGAGPRTWLGWWRPWWASGGDPGSDAVLSFAEKARYKVLAAADKGSGKTSQITTVCFAVAVKGAVPAWGCR